MVVVAVEEEEHAVAGCAGREGGGQKGRKSAVEVVLCAFNSWGPTGEGAFFDITESNYKRHFLLSTQIETTWEQSGDGCSGPIRPGHPRFPKFTSPKWKKQAEKQAEK